MTDLNHWDYAAAFTGQEAATLILGIDPMLEETAKSKPLLQLMQRAYTKTLHAHIDGYWMRKMAEDRTNFKNYDVLSESEDLHRQYRMVEAAENLAYAPQNLHSWRMTAYYAKFPDVFGRTAMGLWEIDIERFERWLKNDLCNGFFHQLSDRQELDRWLNSIGATSSYRFIKENESPSHSNVSKVIRTTPASRRDLLTPVIEHAQRLCRNHLDAPEVWSKLQTLARDHYSPLFGITEMGVQYIDALDSPKILSFRALKERMRRTR